MRVALSDVIFLTLAVTKVLWRGKVTTRAAIDLKFLTINAFAGILK
jgi:hypothetical protein